MVVEKAELSIIDGKTTDFERDFARASKIISSRKGYISHELLKSTEIKGRYLLIVRWETQEDHQEGFRKSKEYTEWKSLLHHYYHPFPEIEYFTRIFGNNLHS